MYPKTEAVIQPDYPAMDFRRYLKDQTTLLLTGAVAAVVMFALLKILFPIPDFFLDSYTYLNVAIFDSEVSYRPKGYSFFLTVAHDISTSANVAVAIQYLVFIVSSLFSFFSCDYLFGFPKRYRTTIFLVVIINPILLLQTNMISSDSLFSSLTIAWFTCGLWIAVRPNPYVLVGQVVLLFFCFNLRYTAIYYPFIAAIFYIISRGGWLFKIAGIAVTCSLIFTTVNKQRDVMENLIGERVMSGFSGWQIANNVLCYYKKIEVEPADLPSDEVVLIDSFVKEYIDVLYKKNDNIGTQYIWEKESPLKQYFVTRKKYGNTYFYEWCAASVYLGEYAWTVIRKDPFAYVRHFMMPNFINYLYPNREVLDNYDKWHSALPAETKEWYGFKFGHLYCRFPNLQKYIMFLYPTISLLINLANIVVIAAFPILVFRYKRKVSGDNWRLWAIWTSFYFSFLLFSIFSTVVLLRYLDPLFTLGLVMPFLFISFLLPPRVTTAEHSNQGHSR